MAAGRRVAWMASWILGLSVPQVVAQDPVITEFLARNYATLVDEDGDSPDWVEIFNPGPGALDLTGWHLTDDNDNLTKWTFPETELPADEFLVVFCSEKDRADPGSELHTNFRLQGSGEFIALVPPDAGYLASFVGPGFPRQLDDISYGCRMEMEETVLVPESTTLRMQVPLDDGLGRTWTEPGFDDTGWSTATAPLGYDTKTSPTYDGLIATNLVDLLRDVGSSVYARVDFNVGDPSTIGRVFLRARYDDAFVASINGVEVARRNARDGEPVWDSTSRASRRDSEAVVFESIALPDVPVPEGTSLLRAGVNTLAVHGINRRVGDSDFLLDVGLLGRRVSSLATNQWEYHSSPTPGLPNEPGVVGISRDPSLSRAAGTFTEGFLLTLTHPDPAAILRYTLDGREPSEESPIYTEPIPISSSVTVKATAYEEGLLPSERIVRTYFAIDASLESWSSNLPVVIVDTRRQAVSGSTLYTECYTATLSPSVQGRTAWSARAGWVGRTGIKLRGSSSRGFPKNNFSFETHDERGDDLDVSLLGLPSHSDWVLHGPYSDKSLMRNYLSYKWSNDIGRYAPRTRFCELFLCRGSNVVRSSDYNGVYLLVERIKRGSERVNVQPVYSSRTQEPDITGGYIIKKDRLGPGETGFVTARHPGGSPLVYVYPKEEFITTAQKAYLRGFMDTFEGALFSANFTDPAEGYAKYCDPGSFIDHHILTELCKNIDGYRLSTFLFKDREGKLNIGPLWDFNLSLGNADYLAGGVPQGWYYPQLGAGDYPWFPRLFQDPAFVAAYRLRWGELRRGPLRTERLLADIDQTAAYLAEAQVRNFTRWRILGTYIWPNYFVARTYQEEIDFMRGWLEGRLEWMDSMLMDPPTFSPEGGLVEPGALVEILAPAGDIYYTLDGTDPRSEGSVEPSPGALLYSGPIVIRSNVRITARVRQGGAWSGSISDAFVVELLPLVVTEVQASPLAGPAGSPFTASDFEFVELLNVGAETIDLAGVQFTGGPRFDFTESGVPSLEPGEYLVVVRDLEAFASRYDVTGLKIAGESARSLSSRATVKLEGPLGEIIQSFRYYTSWYPEAEDGGHSLGIRDPYGDPALWDLEEGWRPSLEPGGTPGRPESDPGGWQRPGDIRQDGRVDVSDAIALLGHLFQGLDLPLPCAGASFDDGANRAVFDVNGSAAVDLADAIHILQYLFARGAPPALGSSCVPIPGCPNVCLP